MRPRILLNFASSLDGKINPAPDKRHNGFVMSRGGEDLRRMLALRAQGDAILVGASNLRTDDPDLAVDPLERARRKDGGQPEPLRVVVTTVGEGLSPKMKIFDPARGGSTVVVHTARMSVATRNQLATVARLVELGEELVDVARLLAWLTIDAHARTVVCEGGGELVAHLFAARAVDELYLTLVPRILGGARAPTLAGGPGFAAEQLPDGQLVSLERVSDELFLRYQFTWN